MIAQMIDGFESSPFKFIILKGSTDFGILFKQFFYHILQKILIILKNQIIF